MIAVDWLMDKLGYIRTAWQILRKEHEWRKVKSTLIFEHNFYYLKDSKTNDGPFCVHCTDTSRKLIHMLRMPEAYICPTCKMVLTHEGEHTSWHIANLYRRNLFGEQEATKS